MFSNPNPNKTQGYSTYIFELIYIYIYRKTWIYYSLNLVNPSVLVLVRDLVAIVTQVTLVVVALTYPFQYVQLQNWEKEPQELIMYKLRATSFGTFEDALSMAAKLRCRLKLGLATYSAVYLVASCSDASKLLY